MIIKSVTILTAAVILIATSGFIVFRHSCHVKNSTEFSLIVPEFTCSIENHEGVDHSCCYLPASGESESCEADKCCSTDSFFVKLNITLDIQDFSKKTVTQDMNVPTNTGYEIVLPSGELSHIIICNGLPPPLSGKALHIFLHQLNIPYASV